MGNTAWFHANNKPKKSGWKVGETKIFEYTGDEQIVELEPGSYKYELWGANGGKYNSNEIPYGGYTAVSERVYTKRTYYLYIGEAGSSAANSQAFNGGGKMNYYNRYSRGGGGGTDMRMNSDYTSRVLVAGGGGGSFHNQRGGYGGGINGGDGEDGSMWVGASGGTQTEGGSYLGRYTGSLFYGGSAANYGCSGGGGYYGGGATSANQSGTTYDTQSGAAGGGSGYIATNRGYSPIGTFRYDEDGYVTKPVSTDNGLIRITKTS